MKEASSALPVPPLEKVQIVNRREGGLIEAFVPISLIYREDVPVDEHHVRELTSSIEREAKAGQGKTGQLSPILLGEIPDFERFPIIDGFHRVAALVSLEKTKVFATIRPNCSWEEIVDLRILAATTHKAVRFSRLMEWVTEAWKYSPLAEKIKVAQAFSFMRPTSKMTGKGLGLDPSEVEELKIWVGRKCAQWQVLPSSVYDHLIIAQFADPDLMKEVREGEKVKSRGGLAAITPFHLREIAKALPNKWELQKLVAQAVRTQNFTILRTRAVAVAVTKAANLEEARKIIQSGDWRVLEAVYGPSRTREEHRRMGREETTINPRLLEEFFRDEIEIARLTIENAILAGRYQPSTDGGRGKTQEVESLKTPETPAIIIEGNLVPEAQPRAQLTEEQIQEVAQQTVKLQTPLSHWLSNEFGIKSEDAKDIISDAILHTFEQIQKGKFQYQGEMQLKHWMFKVVRNIVIDKQRKTVPQSSLDALIRDDQDNETLVRAEAISEEGSNEEIDRAVEENDYRSTLKKVLLFLPEEQRRTFVLGEFFKLPMPDIAQILGKSSSLIRVTLLHARRKIAKFLAREITG